MSDVIVQAVAALDHHVDELVEVNGTVGVGVHIPDHVFQVLLTGVEAMSPHHLATNCMISIR